MKSYTNGVLLYAILGLVIWTTIRKWAQCICVCEQYKYIERLEIVQDKTIDTDQSVALMGTNVSIATDTKSRDPFHFCFLYIDWDAFFDAC